MVGSTAWELDFRQLSRGQSTLPASLIQGASSLWMKVQALGLVHQRALPPPGHITIGLTDNPEARAQFGSHDVDWNELTLFDADDGIDCVSKPGFSAYTISFTEQRLQCIARSLGVRCPSDDRTAIAHRASEPQDMARLRRLLAEFNAVMFTGTEKQRRNALADAESDFPVLLLQAWNRSQPSSLQRGKNRHRALARALAYIEDNPQSVIGVEALCLAAACSLSTLERAFAEHFQVSPKRYLVAIRLSAVRRALLENEQTRTIADIAADWGFWHMSKFAQDYRTMFGEKPSDTLTATLKRY